MASTKPHHHKLSRKELKQPDEFQSFFENARDFILENLNQVIMSVVIVLVAAAVALGTFAWERHRDALAAHQFYAAMTALGEKDYKQAEHGFTQLAEKQPGLEVGRLSRLYLGLAYLRQNDLKQARDALVAYVAQGHKQLFTNLALANLALVYERLGEFGKAEHAYSQAAATPGPEQTYAELGAARMLLKQGKKEQAVKAYQRFLTDYPFSPQRENVLESLALLGAGAPSQVKLLESTAPIPQQAASPKASASPAAPK